MPTPGTRPSDSEFGFAGQEPVDPATGRPLPIRQGGRYRGRSPENGEPDDRADPGTIIKQ